MVKVERIDTEGSFTTMLRVFTDANSAVEINVPVWEADAMEDKIKAVTKTKINQLLNKSGTTVVRDD